MHVAAKIGIGVGLVAGAGLLLAACGSSEKDPQKVALDEFGKFDRSPKDNKWTKDETTRSWIHTRDQEVNTYRVGDYIFGTKQRLQWESTDSMRRVFDAAKGNDAVLSLQELRDFALTYDADKNGTLNRQERRSFEDAYGVTTTRTQARVVDSWSFSRYSPVDRYPRDGGYGGTSPGDDYGGGTSPGDDYGGGYGGGTSPGDSGGYTPPSSGGGTSPGDGGGYTPPSSGGGSGGSSGGNSTDNGNPGYDDF